jgi:hypothetical protein
MTREKENKSSRRLCQNSLFGGSISLIFLSFFFSFLCNFLFLNLFNFYFCFVRKVNNLGAFFF